MKRLMLVSVGLLAVLACAPAADQPAATPAAPDSAAALAAAELLAQRYTEFWLAQNPADIAGLFTEDATADFLGFPSTTGRTGIQAVYASAFEASGKAQAGKLSVTAAKGVAPGLLNVSGTSYDVFDSSGTTRTTYWRWAAAIRQGSDGQWRFAYVMAFPDSTTRKQ